MVLNVFKAWITFIENGGILKFELRTNIFEIFMRRLKKQTWKMKIFWFENPLKDIWRKMTCKRVVWEVLKKQCRENTSKLRKREKFFTRFNSPSRLRTKTAEKRMKTTSQQTSRVLARVIGRGQNRYKEVHIRASRINTETTLTCQPRSGHHLSWGPTETRVQ